MSANKISSKGKDLYLRLLKYTFRHKLVFVNKIDRPRVVPEIAIDKVLDLFLELGADDDQCDFPYLFGSGLSGFAKEEMESNSDNMMPLFEAIIRHVPPPVGDANKPLQLQITTLDYSEFLGRIVIGKIHNGTIKKWSTG